MQIKLSSWYFTLMKKKTVRYPKLHINATEIERTDHFNFLGLQLNHNLKWNTHIDYVSLKISKVTGLLYKLKSVYPITILKSIYNTLVLPMLITVYFHGGLKSIEYTFGKNGQFKIFQRVISGHIPNPYLKSTIY